MTRELAEAFGEPLVVPSKLRRGEGGNSMISEVIDYLSQAHAKTMEQEQIDPQIPETTD
jgi:tRNA A37 threonylcarbamoyladenosine synthetase subunit TsaC/SUA5/YrdC